MLQAQRAYLCSVESRISRVDATERSVIRDGSGIRDLVVFCKASFLLVADLGPSRIGFCHFVPSPFASRSSRSPHRSSESGYVSGMSIPLTPLSNVTMMKRPCENIPSSEANWVSASHSASRFAPRFLRFAQTRSRHTAVAQRCSRRFAFPLALFPANSRQPRRLSRRRSCISGCCRRRLGCRRRGVGLAPGNIFSPSLTSCEHSDC